MSRQQPAERPSSAAGAACKCAVSRKTSMAAPGQVQRLVMLRPDSNREHMGAARSKLSKDAQEARLCRHAPPPAKCEPTAHPECREGASSRAGWTLHLRSDPCYQT